VLDRPAFTTDVIIGFPGESEEDFEATCGLVRRVGFARIHIFSYSPRAGTEAAGWSENVPPAVVAERRARLLGIESDLAEAYCRSLLGRRLDVLVEGADPQRQGFVRGTACRSVPVVCRGYAPALIRRRVPVRAVAVEGGVIIGEPEASDVFDLERERLPRIALSLAVDSVVR
jgi:threonylcarbamoyladenosine tRNA methylthiotransferase MtaB